MLCFADNVEQKWGTKIHFVLNAASTSRMGQLRNKRKKNSGERKTKRRGKGMNMQNDTFNQILNSNLASMDPGFGQFALAKASSDLFKKVINK